MSELFFHRKIAVGLNTKGQLIGHSFASALNCFELVFRSLELSMMPCSISARKDPSLEQTLWRAARGPAPDPPLPGSRLVQSPGFAVWWE